MRRKPAPGRGVSRGEFDGRKLRSALKWKILGTLLGRFAAPMAAAHLYEFIRTGSARNISEWAHRVRHPSYVYVYLRRMAEEGLLELRRLDAALSATLTDRGRTELERYSDYWGKRGISSADALARLGRGARAGGGGQSGGGAGKSGGAGAAAHGSRVTRAGVPQGAARGRGASPSPAAGGGRRTEAVTTKAGEGRPKRDGPAALAAQCKGLVRRKATGGRPEGFGGSTGFVSYDLPMAEHGRRRRLLAVLKAGGYSPVHASMYAGPGRALSAVVQTLEGAGFSPHLRWGSLRLMDR